MFRRQRGLENTRCCDLDEILDEAQVEVATSERDEPGFAAVLIRLQGGGAGIMMAANQSKGRRRFSIGHELGHFFIPSHANAGPTLKCANAELRARSTDKRQLEWEANDFASELLMPKRLFVADIRDRPVSFATIEHLTDDQMYQVSRTAAAWRLVQTTREQCALVMTTNGNVDWVARSDSMRYWISERGQPVGKGSVAAAVIRGEPGTLSAERVAPAEWLEARHGESLTGVEVFESTHRIPSRGQVLSLVWVNDDIDGEDADD